MVLNYSSFLLRNLIFINCIEKNRTSANLYLHCDHPIIKRLAQALHVIMNHIENNYLNVDNS